jgi:glutamate dehydrogenase (NADP+)
VVLAVSDSKGALVEPDGFTREQLLQVVDIKKSHSGDLKDYKSDTCKYYGDRAKPWGLDEVGALDLAFPCATQGELDADDAAALAEKEIWAVIEGANMPCTDRAVKALKESGILFVPGKVANAGGVAVSGLEMAQNRTMLTWNGTQVYDRLYEIMKSVYRTSKAAAEEYGVDLGDGANIAAFLRVADAMVAQGAV